MGYRIIFDANVYVQFAAYGRIENLAAMILQYEFEVYATNHLLHEVHQALLKPGILKSATVSPDEVVEYLSKLLFMSAERPAYQLSPDYDDNYLFDIALQQGCIFLVTSDKALLNIKNPPVPVFSTQWFKENFKI
jgi:predicted nucleic acid-binding protein